MNSHFFHIVTLSSAALFTSFAHAAGEPVNLVCQVKSPEIHQDVGTISSVTLQGSSIAQVTMQITRTPLGSSSPTVEVYAPAQLESSSMTGNAFSVWYGEQDTGLILVSHDGGRTFDGDPESNEPNALGLIFEEDFAYAVKCKNLDAPKISNDELLTQFVRRNLVAVEQLGTRNQLGQIHLDSSSVRCVANDLLGTNWSMAPGSCVVTGDLGSANDRTIFGILVSFGITVESQAFTPAIFSISILASEI